MGTTDELRETTVANDFNRAKVESYAIFLLAVAIVALIVKVALVIRWLIYWIIIAGGFMFLFSGSPRSLFWISHQNDTSKSNRRFIILIVLAALEIATLFVYFVTHWIYPRMLHTNRINATRWWQVKRSPCYSSTITYKSKARILTRKRNSISYVGGLNAKLEPHGYGYWADSSYHGERLSGNWQNGTPVGPFRSFEHGSGYCFVNIRIAYCTNRAENSTSAIQFFPKHSQRSLQWGVASVECSVSGGFFKFLPEVKHLTPYNTSETMTSAAACLTVLRTAVDCVVFQEPAEESPPANQLEGNISSMPDHIKTFSHLHHENSIPRLISQPYSGEYESSTESRTTRIESGNEALILLHGYNCSIDYGINRLGQLLALGNFPSHIHPFVFSWPSGGVLAYFQAKTIGTESTRTAYDFQTFLRSLVSAGYTKINILGHSMGARVYFICLEKGLLEDIFYTQSELRLEDPICGTKFMKAKLSTLTFVNPDYERNEFVKMGGTYDMSRSYCEIITLYADALDGALFYAENLTKESLFGPPNYSMGKRGDMMHRISATETTRTKRKTHTSHDSSSESWHAKTVDAILRVNQSGKFDGVEALSTNNILHLQDWSDDVDRFDLQHLKRSAEEDVCEYLDMDVVDTTWMDQNVHSIRHNYFNINPSVVDDLRTLIVNKRRASTRCGLMRKREGTNIFIFLVAPSIVKND
ncbi:unnamed protein product [Albugo candida]|uniref:Uncharacterized protein n=1 Tax=Albugo candida TaxID=65357 RepID=A0A024G2Q5_9STRA|nr:unnamed protein product [Albugo candida]|eukprot:CCI40598.1 unnamed protein product [Albugo candida]